MGRGATYRHDGATAVGIRDRRRGRGSRDRAAASLRRRRQLLADVAEHAGEQLVGASSGPPPGKDFDHRLAAGRSAARWAILELAGDHEQADDLRTRQAAWLTQQFGQQAIDVIQALHLTIAGQDANADDLPDVMRSLVAAAAGDERVARAIFDEPVRWPAASREVFDTIGDPRGYDFDGSVAEQHVLRACVAALLGERRLVDEQLVALAELEGPVLYHRELLAAARPLTAVALQWARGRCR